MTTLRTAAQQALEALEKTVNVWGGTCAWHGDVKRAIIALRAALAQEQAEPVQEPVAWCSSVEFIDALKYAHSFNGWRRKYSKTDMPLYTAPPKAEPLPLKTVERLIYENTKINPNVADDRELLGYIVNAVRAVERAHGIGGQDGR